MSGERDAPIDRYRRRLLGGVAAVTALSVAPGVFLHRYAAAKPEERPVTGIKRWGLLVDTGKCADDCQACVDACRDEHGWTGHDRPRSDPQWIRKVRVRDRATGRATSLPMLCQHCAHPPCVDVCPTGASFKRADGIVLVDKHTCIGCRYCMMACPFKARSFVHEALSDQRPHSPRGKGTVESCTLCVHRVDAGKQPACVDACSKDGGAALLFGDLNDPQDPLYQALARLPSRRLRDDLGLEQGVRYHGL
ncbi:MAG TPA: 4Fe-4S dicluster domain-containing protein [Gammaproteobacteria bacterium]